MARPPLRRLFRNPMPRTAAGKGTEDLLEKAPGSTRPLPVGLLFPIPSIYLLRALFFFIFVFVFSNVIGGQLCQRTFCRNHSADL